MSNATATAPTRALLWVSLLQGACLYHLYGAVQTERWPATSPLWHYPLWTLAVLSPLLLLLSVSRENWRPVSRDIAIASIALVLAGMYTGTQAEPLSAFPTGDLVTAYVITMFIAGFKILVHIQRRAEGAGLSYPSLFTNSWRSFLVAVLGGGFALIFWLILLLWGALFDAIGVGFFSYLFRQEWFAIPTVTLAFGIGVLLFRSHTRIIDSITQLLHSLIKLLLPLVVILAAVFLLALPFTGLQPLWDTGSGTALLLWLLAVMLFFINAVYQDGRQGNPYPLLLHRMIYLGICVAPVLSALAFYGLFLRLREYGWTVERCWAFVTWLLLSLFALGYVLGVIRRRDEWTGDLARTNTAMSLLLLAITLLSNSPVLDFRKIALASQVDRVETGRLALVDLDFWYIRQHLARPGYRYMERLRSEFGDDDPDLLAALDRPRMRFGTPRDPDRLWAELQLRPADVSVPPALQQLIRESASSIRGDDLLLVAQDLDGDGAQEYLLFELGPGDFGALGARLFYRHGESWRSGLVAVRSTGSDDPLTDLREAPIQLREKRFMDLDIGGVRLSVNEMPWD